MSKYRTEEIESLAAVFKALSNPQRLRIFLKLAADCGRPECCEERLLDGGEYMRRCVGELGSDAGIAASTLSHHLKELRNAGLMNIERKGKRIECWMSVEKLQKLTEFLEVTQGQGTARQGCGHAAESGDG